MTDFCFYPHDSPQYAADFQTLLRCLGERPGLEALLDQVLAPYGPEAVAVDWGAGSGDLTARLLRRFRKVYAVEPNEALAAVLTTTCPGAHLVRSSIFDTVLPEPADVALLCHVLYHVPDHKWGAYVLRAAAGLSVRGLLVVVLKHPDSACNAMLEAFGARRFNLFVLDEVFRHHPEYRVERVVIPGPIVTHSWEDTLAIVRFMLADREPDAYARRFTEEEVLAYVRQHLWNEQTGTGGWRCDALAYLIRPNAFWRQIVPGSAG